MTLQKNRPNKLTVFTKSWTAKDMRLEQLGKFVKELGFDGIELPVRPGYQVEPENIEKGLREARRILEEQGVRISSVAANADERTINAMGAAGLKILRICVPIDMKIGYLATEAKVRKEWDTLIPVLDAARVTIGVQNHCDYFVGSAIGIMHLIEKYDPRHVSVVLDCGHCAVDGESELMALDIVWSHLSLVNLKSAFHRRANGPEEVEAQYAIHWTTCHHAGYSWSRLVNELKRRGYTGDICLPAEYTRLADGGQLMGKEVLRPLRIDLAYVQELLARLIDEGAMKTGLC